MKDSLRVVIKDIELQKLNYRTTNESLKEIFDISLDTKIAEKIDTGKDIEHHIDIVGKFDVKTTGMLIDGEYILEIIFLNFGDEEALEEFIQAEKYEISYPMLSKISGLISKTSEELRLFPLIISMEDWMRDKETNE